MLLRHRYVDGLTAAVGSPEALRPTQPPLKRYKRDVALRLQSAGGGGGAYAATLPHAKCATSPCALWKPCLSITCTDAGW